jgi:hypothetical protein
MKWLPVWEGVISEMILLSFVPLRALVRNLCRLMANNIQTSSKTLRVLPYTQNHTEGSLSPLIVAPNPHEQFRTWFTEAPSGISEPEIVTLSTATASGISSARTVLLKQVGSTDFVFFTNCTSKKSKGPERRPRVLLGEVAQARARAGQRGEVEQRGE